MLSDSGACHQNVNSCIVSNLLVTVDFRTGALVGNLVTQTEMESLHSSQGASERKVAAEVSRLSLKSVRECCHGVWGIHSFAYSAVPWMIKLQRLI